MGNKMATSSEDISNSSTTLELESKSSVFCLPCQSDGKSLAAVGYCETCEASLCKRCFECHTIPIPTRNHRLLKREQAWMEHEVNDDIGQCPEHDGEMVLYHCHAHSFLGCQKCFFQHQKLCRDARYIPNISETTTSLDDLEEFMAELKYTFLTCKTLKDDCKHNVTLIETCHTNAIAAVKAFKVDLLATIDQLENEIYKNAERFKQKEKSKMNRFVGKCQQIQTEIQAIATEMETLQSKNRNNDLYISMVKSKNKVVSLETELNTAKGGNILKLFNFESNAEIRETFKSPFGLGKLRPSSDSVKTEHMKDINVKLQDDRYTCCITGLVTIPEHILVVADNYNNNVKVIDTKQQVVLSNIELGSGPWSLAKVKDNTVATTLPDEKRVTFIRFSSILSIDSEIGVNGECRGVAYSDGKLVVSFTDPQKVEIMDLKGSVLRKIEAGGDGQPLFNYPYYVAISSVSSLIYVSNYYSHSVVCLRFDGTVVATYQDKDLYKPYQVIVDSSGDVYVCGHTSYNVHQLSQDCKKLKVLLESTDGYPCTLSYEENEGRFYVGQWKNNNVRVYQQAYE